MDHTRVILAIALSFLVFIVWQFFFAPEVPVQKPAEKTTVSGQTEEADKSVTSEKPYSKSTESSEAVESQPVTVPQTTGRTITVDTPFYRVELTEGNAAVKSFILKKYREYVEKDAPLKQMLSPEITEGTVLLTFSQNSVPQLSNSVFTTQNTDTVVNVTDEPVDLTFSLNTDQGVVIDKTFRFDPKSYLVGLTVDVKNGSSEPIKDRLAIRLNKIVKKDKRAYGFEGPATYINDDLDQIDIGDIEDKDRYDGVIDWVAVQSRYFISSLIPETPTEATFQLAQKPGNVLAATYILPEINIKPGTQKSFQFKIFQGPMSTRLLNSYGYKLGEAVNFGMFDILAKPCLWLMNFIYNNLIPNYGIAIIMLTLLTKVLLWPLGTKSYKSMGAMKKLQPLIKEIKEKYGDDRKRVNEETMALYRTYKINPLGGCLPMLVQIPVFFALYRMLYEAIELRHAPFFGWINDLSAPDRLFSFGFSIPFMEPPYGIPVLTLVMGATMFLQQKMSPPMGDAAQAKMMMLLPIVFTFIFINFSSGLVLYWLVNNVVSIGQQYYITKKNA
jgi:YidC/Oxa1 family membrane protein insertase